MYGGILRGLVAATAAAVGVTAVQGDAPVALPGTPVAAESPAASPAAAAAGGKKCRPTPDLLAHRPVRRIALPRGAYVRVWDTGRKKKVLAERRVVAVTVPQGALTPRVVTAPTIASAVRPSAMVRRDGRSVVLVNGGHFDPTVPGIPTKSQMVDGHFRKGIRVRDNNVAVYATGKVAVVRASMAGTFRSRHGSRQVGALNWQKLVARGITAYTHAWGSRPHPYGPRTVVVVHDRVTKVLKGRRGAHRPRPGEVYLTSRRGPVSAELGSMRRGERVTVTLSADGHRVVAFARRAPDIGAPSGLLGAGGTIVLGGRNRAHCDARDEQLRPRSLLGWKRNGDLIVAAVSGRATKHGSRFGGASVHQAAELMKTLGAVRVVNFDGGGSTALFVRTRVGGRLVRLDRSNRAPQRPVTDGLAFRAVPPRGR